MFPRRILRTFEIVLRFSLVALLAVPESVWANPSGGTVVAGGANISSSGSTLTIQQLTNNAVINWNNFSISLGELTKFIQPSQLSAVLNRVIGGNESLILGNLSGNGKVYLINPNGVVIGSSANIQTGSFLASTLDVSNDNFMKGGALNFTGSSLASVKNSGTINALGGDVFLIAHTVENTGTINAAHGTVGLAAGSEVLLKPKGNDRIFIKAGNGTAATGVDQQGQINAASAELKAAGGNVYAVAINNGGTINATSIGNKGGRIVLQAGNNGQADGVVLNSGTLKASKGNTGGEVKMIGSQVGLMDNSLIDVSGANGGGTAYIGGGDHGQNSSIPDASQVYVSPTARILADATNNGNGGHVVLWSNDYTQFYGNISAQGGKNGGNGGYVEVSGGNLNYNGNVNTLAPQGATGMLLLDPNNLFIQATGPNSQTYPNNTFPTADNDTANSNTSILTTATLDGQLNSTNVNLNAAGNITFAASSPVSWNSSYSLDATAGNSVIVNSSISNAGTGGVTLQSGGGFGNNIQLGANVTTAGGSQTYNGPVVLEQNESLASGGGTITFSNTVDANTNQSLATTGGGATIFNNAVGSNNALSSLSTSGATTINGGVTTSGSSGQSYGGAVTLGSTSTLDTTNGGNTNGGAINFSSTIDGAHSLTLTAGNGNVTFGGNVGTGTALHNLIVNGTGITYLGGNVTTGNFNNQTYNEAVVLNNNSILNTAGNGAITFGSTVDAASPGVESLSTTGGGATTFDNTVGVTHSLSSLSTSGATTLDNNVTTSGTQTYGGAVTLGGNDTLTTTNSSITFDSTVAGQHSLSTSTGSGSTIFDSTVGSGGFGNVLTSLSTSGATTLDNNVTTSGTQTYGGAVTLGGDDTLTTTANNSITFDSTVAGQHSLATSTGSGATVFENTVGSGAGNVLTSLSTSGATTLDNNVTTSGTQTYGGAVTLGGDDTLTTTANNSITFDSTVAGQHSLATSTGSGATVFENTVGSGAGNVLTSLSTSGATTLDNNVTTSGTQTYGGAVTLGGNDTLTTTNSAVTFSSTVDGAHTLGVNSGTGTTTFTGAVGSGTALTSLTTTNTGVGVADINGGSVKTSGNQTYNGNVNLGAATTLISTGNGAVAFNSNLDGGNALIINNGTGATTFNTVGGNAPLASLASNGTGTTTLDGSITTSGAQSYAGAVTLGQASGVDLLKSTGSIITFDSTVNGTTSGTQGLATNSSGNTTFESTVGAGTALASLSTTGTAVLDGNVTTSGISGQTYNNAVILGNSDTLSATGGGNIDFVGTVDATTAGSQGLITNSGTGITTFGSNVGTGESLASLSATGTTAINANITTVGTQTYNSAVTLGGTGVDTLNTTNSNVTFLSTVNGPQGLTVNPGSGNVAFDGNVGHSSSLANLTVNGTGTTTLGDPAISVTTVGDQTYNQAVQLIDDTTLTSSAGNIFFNNTLDGGHNLTLNAADDIDFADPVGSSTALTSIDVTGATLVDINGGSVTTTGFQTYSAPTELSADTTLSTTNSPVTFGSTLNGNDNDLTVDSGSGNIIFIGAVTDINNISLNSTGTLEIGSSITTNGDQDYNQNILLIGGPVVLTSNYGQIDLGKTVNGDYDLTLTDGEGDTTLGGNVGNITPLASLTVSNGVGTTYLNGTVINTVGGQTFDQDVVLGKNTTLTSSNNGMVAFGQSLDGPFSLTINNGTGTTTFGTVGASTPLTRLASNGTGTTTLDGNITTSGTQLYAGPVTLGNDVALTTSNSNITFDKTVDATATGGDQTLFIFSGSGNVNFGGNVGTTGAALATALGGLSISGTGTTTLNGNVTTVGDQDYNEKVSLGTNAILASNGGQIDLANTVNGAHNLTLTAGSGDTTLSGNVGNTVALTSLTVSAGTGTTYLNSGSVITTAGQSFGQNTVLGKNTTLTSSNNGAVSFGDDLDGSYALTVNNGTGTTSFDTTGSVAALTSLASNGTGLTNLNGNVTTTGTQTYAGPVAINSNDVLTTNNSNVTFDNSVGGINSLGLAVGTGNVTFENIVGGGLAPLTSLTITGTGTTTLDNNVTTTGSQTYGENVALGTANATLTSNSNGTVTFDGTVNGASNLVIANGTGATTFDGPVGNTTALTSLASNGTGTTDLNGGSITTTGSQSYAGPVILTANTTINATNSGVTFSNTIDGNKSLTINNGTGTTALDGSVGSSTPLTSLASNGTGNTTLGGAVVTTSGTQTYAGPVLLTNSNTAINTTNSDVTFLNTINAFPLGQGNLTINPGSGNVTFDENIGVSPLASLTVNGTGTNFINAGMINTLGFGNETFNEAIVLGSNLSLTPGISGTVTFNNTVNGAYGLTVDDSLGSVIVNGAIGNSTALSSLSLTDAFFPIQLNGGTITTSGTQTYIGNVLLGSNNTLNTTNSAINFNGKVDGANSLTLNPGSGNVLFSNVVGTTPLTSLTVNGTGTTTVDNNVTTVGAQKYNESVLLNAASNAFSTTNSNVSFNGTVDGPSNLTVTDGSGTTTFAGAVGSGTTLSSLTVSAGAGTTDLNGGSVSTAGGQTYGQNVVLSANTTLNDSTNGTIAFNANLDGAKNLTINNGSGATTFGTVGGTTPLASLTSNGTGFTSLNGNISTTGNQLYAGSVSINSNDTLTTTNSNVTFKQSVGGINSLALTVGTGNVTFENTVGSVVSPLTSLTITGTGTTTLDNNVTTTGSQTYGENVALGGDSTLTSNNNGVVTFDGTVNGASNLTITNGTGITTFDGAVGTTNPLASLTVNGGTDLNGGTVTTSGQQHYNGPVVLGTNNVVSANNSWIDFDGTVDGPYALTVNAGSTLAEFDSTVGGTTALTSLTVNGSGTTDLNGGTITTTGAQTYNENVLLSADAILNAPGGVTFAGTVDDGNTAGTDSLTVDPTTGNVVFEQSVGGNAALDNINVQGVGTTFLGGNVTTTGGNQTYNESIVLANNSILTTDGAGTVTLKGSVNGNHSLTVNTMDGDLTLDGAIGTTTALTGLTLNNTGLGIAHLNGGVIDTTTGTQTYNGATVLGADTIFNTQGGSVAFGNTLDGANTVAINPGSGNVTFTGAVGSNNPLVSLTVNGTGTTTLDDNVTTTGTQTYNEAVQVGNSLTLDTTDSGTVPGADITFTNTVDDASAGDTLTLTPGTGNVILDGAVGSNSPLGGLTISTGTGYTFLTNGNVTTDGDQNYGEAVILNNSVAANQATLTSNSGNITAYSTIDGNHALVLNATGGTVTLDKAVGSLTPLTSLTTTANETDLNGGSVTTVGAQTYNGSVFLSSDDILNTTNSAISFNGTIDGNQNLILNDGTGITTFGDNVGKNNALASLASNGTGTTNVDGLLMITDGTQYYAGPVVLDSSNPLAVFVTNGNNITFNNTINNAVGGVEGIAVNAGSGNVTFDGAIGNTTALAYLNVNNGSGTTNFNGGSVNTTDGQTYGQAVVLGANTTLNTTNSSNISFNQTVNGPYALTLNNGSGRTTFTGAVGNTGTGLASLASNGTGTTEIRGGSVTTTGTQLYAGPVVLYNNTNFNTTNSNVTFDQTVDAHHSGAESLTATVGSGNVTFGDAIGNNNALSTLTINGTGTTTLNGTSVTTVDTQSYGENVVLGADNTLNTTDSDISFTGTINGNHALDLEDGLGITTFGEAIGNTAALTTLISDGTGTTNINGGLVNTTGTQSYTGPVVLGANDTLDTSNSDITFDSTVDAVTVGGGSLSANVGSGNVTFADAIGGTNALSSLAITGSGTTTLNGDFVTTTGNQSYGENLVLGADNTLDTTNSAIGFNGTIDGAQNLTLNNGTGATSFLGAVGSNTALTTLTSNGTGTTDINGGSVTTTATQSYAGPVVLTANTTLNTTNSQITFDSSIDGANTLTLNPGGANVVVDGAIGANTALTGLTVNGTGSTLLNNGNVTTNGNQVYNEAVTGPNVILNAGSGDITWNAALNATTVEAFAQNINMNGIVTTTSVPATNSTAVLLVAQKTFNDKLDLPINMNGGGRFLIYSADPSLDNVNFNAGGALITPGAFAQFNTTYQNGPGAAYTTNGFLFQVNLPATSAEFLTLEEHLRGPQLAANSATEAGFSTWILSPDALAYKRRRSRRSYRGHITVRQRTADDFSNRKLDLAWLPASSISDSVRPAANLP